MRAKEIRVYGRCCCVRDGRASITWTDGALAGVVTMLLSLSMYRCSDSRDRLHLALKYPSRSAFYVLLRRGEPPWST